MISAYFVPLWQILMWAPQYPEGLGMKIWINNITGDVKIISALNHYIGMRHIEVSMFPEFEYMIYIVAFVIAVGLLTSLVNRRGMLYFYAGLIVACGMAALVDFYLWGYDYGHNLDPNAAIIVPGMVYQPPVIGTKQLLNFTAFSGPDIGGWIFMASGLLAVAAVIWEIVTSRRRRKNNMKQITISLLFLACFLCSCTSEPEPLQFGQDACHTCKMTLMDKKFGAELVSKKGKIYKFDDVNCMLTFYNSGEVEPSGFSHKLVVDFSQPATLIEAADAFYLKSPDIKSPMASQVAAFQKKETMETLKKDYKGIYLVWGELVTQFK
jgi:copper chaperone NosL